VENLLF